MVSNNTEATSTWVTWALYDYYNNKKGQINPQEPIKCYKPGGFHAVALGDAFKGGSYNVSR